MTYEEVKAELLKMDEITLMELLQVSSEDLLDKFDERLVANYPYVYEQVTGESLGGYDA